MALLIDLQDVCTTEHCLHLISWLEAQSAWLASPAFNSGATSQYIVSASNTVGAQCSRGCCSLLWLPPPAAARMLQPASAVR